MVNLLLTNYCNRSCPYCFAKQKVELDKINGLANEQITLENAEKVAKFFRKERQMGLLGGEPTLHPQFKEIVDIFLNYQYNITIFTNGIFSSDVLEFLQNKLSSRNSISLLFNINEPKFYKKEELEILDYNLKELSIGFSDAISIGINFFYLEQDYSYMIDLAKKYGIKAIRWDIAHPIVYEKNVTIPLEKYNLIGKKIASFAKEASKYGIVLRADCGASVYCMFDKEARKNVYDSFMHRLFGLCKDGGAIDVGIDLRVWRCFPLSKYFNKNLDEFKNLKDIQDYFNKKYAYFFHGIYPMDRCYTCKYAIKEVCTGSCLSRSIIKYLEREEYFYNEFYTGIIKNLNESKLKKGLILAEGNKILKAIDKEKVVFSKKDDLLGAFDFILSDFLQNFNPLSVKLFSKTKSTIIPEKISVYGQFAEHEVKIRSKKFIKFKNTKELRPLGEPFLVYDTDFKEIRFVKTEVEPKGKYIVLFYEVNKDKFLEKNFNSLSKEGFCWILPMNNTKVDLKAHVEISKL